MPNYCANPVGGTVSPCFPDHCLKEFLICPQFAVLGVSQITSQSQTVTAASRPFEVSWSKTVQKILNDFKILSSNDNGQWVNGALLKGWVEPKWLLWDVLID